MSAVLELPTLEKSIVIDDINEKSIIFALEERKHAVFFDVSWETYEDLLELFPKRRNPKLMYDRGMLEIMPLPEHEIPIFAIYSLVDIFALAMEVETHCIGASTLKRRDLKHGFEPDCAFYFGKSADLMRDKDVIDLHNDPTPDLVIEIDVTHSSLGKFELFAEVGIKEIWLFEGKMLKILCLEKKNYQETSDSRLLPNVTSQIITEFALENRKIGRIQWHKKVTAWAKNNLKKQ